MNYPLVNYIEPLSEMTNAFTGYNHTVAGTEGSYYDMKNISSDYFPALSPRKPRGICRTFTNFQGMIDKEGLYYIDDGKLYANGTEKTGITFTTGMKSMVKMGAYIIVFPDGKWFNTLDDSSGSINNEVSKTGETITFSLARQDGTVITYHDAAYYEEHAPQNGDYKVETTDGKTSLQIYSSLTKMWSSVPTTYIKVGGTGLGAGFVQGDGVKVTVDLTGITWADASNIFVNDEGDGKRSSNFYIASADTDYIVIPAILQENKTYELPIVITRDAPSMAFVVECQNRLWGCSADGHEIYCSKLGDFKNWNTFEGISTDSWAATIGSDGKFTGAINFQGSPIFFKENSLVRVGVSTIGAHTTRETNCRGVAEGSSKSLALVNEILFYKSTNSICMYDGSYPVEISANFGDIRYISAVGGSVGNKYFICLKDENNAYSVFNYDTSKGIWVKEDLTNVTEFCRVKTELFFASNNTLYSVNGTGATNHEKKISWMIESNNIGYLYTSKTHARRVNDKQFIQKIKINAKLEVESYVSVYINYDSSDQWEFLWNISGKGTNLTPIPVKPHRCNHFRYRLVGYGDAKIFSVTKDYTEGSDR